MTVLIFANGECDLGGWLRPHLETATVLLAADGGTYHLLKLGLRPHLVMGDLDSLDPATLADLAQTGVDIRPHPRDKDETDLELLLLYAAATYPQLPIRIVGGFGGRLDQTLANILLLAHPQLRGRDIQLMDNSHRAWLIHDQTTIQGEIGDTVSFIPLGGHVHIQQTTGLKWSLQAEWLHFGPARGISNVLTHPVATIQISAGVLLCIHIRQEADRSYP
ncbi:MAG: thiamine diphosphokinase [Chloroflexi bacterium]|nr:thiamine diphosphokinase [Chloroflexota bacterium]MBP8058159.1 thiamine diphosphokinase [Chloroflexota bacterium]